MKGGYRLDEMDPLSADAEDVGLLRQVMAAELVTHGDGWERGVRSVLLQNERISLEVVLDRALDIANARIDGIPVAWRPPTGIVGPWFVENQGFGPQRSFFGGLLTTCGLDHVGPPTERSAERFGYAFRTVDHFPMHGRISGSPGRLLGYGVRADPEHGLVSFVEGEVSQVSLFGEHLVLRRTVSLPYGSCVIDVADEVSNLGYTSGPLAVLYHVNAGWPVVAPGARVLIDGRRRRGEGDDSLVPAPAAGRPERSWLYAVGSDASGTAHAAIVNDRLDRERAAGLRISWDAAALPSLTHWETANVAGHYAIGLEPATAIPDGPAQERRFPAIEPGERVTLGLRIELMSAAAGALGTD